MTEGQAGVQKGKFSVFSGKTGGADSKSPWADVEKAYVLGHPGAANWIAQRLTQAIGLPVEAAPLEFAEAAEATLLSQLQSLVQSLPSRDPSRLLLHPGMGTLARSADFFQACQSLGVRFLGPSAPSALSVFNRLNFLLRAEGLGIPNLVVSREPLTSLAETRQLLTTLRADAVVLKSVFQTGRAANLAVDRISLEQAPFEDRFSSWVEQMRWRGGEPLFFAERTREGARKIILPFSKRAGPVGTGVRFYSTVDRSLQSRSRVRAEVAPAPGLSSWVLDQIQEHSRRLIDFMGWSGVGATEWLVDGVDCILVDAHLGLDFSALLWGGVSQVCPVREQLIAAGFSESLVAPDPRETPASESTSKAGVITWIHAEDPLLEVPSQGECFFASRGEDLLRTLGEYQLGYHLDLSGKSGWSARGEECAVLGFAWVMGPDIGSCLDACSALLEDIWVAGTQKTTLPLIQSLMNHPWVKEWMVHAGFLESEFIPDYHLPSRAKELFRWVKQSLKDQPTALEKLSVWEGEGDLRSEPIFEVERTSGHYRVFFGSLRKDGESPVPVAVVVKRGGLIHVQYGHWHWQFAPVSSTVGDSSKMPSKVTLRAQSGGSLYRLSSGEGASVRVGDCLGWMKVRDELLMIAAPVDATVLTWEKQAGERVVTGDTLILLERIQSE